MSIAFGRREERAPVGGACAGGGRKGLLSPAALWHNGIDSRGGGPAGKAGMEDEKQEAAKCPEPKTEEYGESPEDGAEGA